MSAFLCLLAGLFVNNGTKMELSYNGGILNEGASLRHFWLNSNQKVDAEFVGIQGVSVRVSDDGQKFYYRFDYKIKARKEMRAFQLTVVVFDIGRRFKENWRPGKVIDLKEGEVLEGFFEKEVTREEAEMLGGSFSYISTTINATAGATHFDIESVFTRLRGFLHGFKSSWVNL